MIEVLLFSMFMLFSTVVTFGYKDIFNSEFFSDLEEIERIFG